jgi:hypothetical protein
MGLKFIFTIICVVLNSVTWLPSLIGSVRSHWSCYFLPETSAECKQRALELALQEDAWKQGIITRKENYTTKEIWVGKTPR